MKSLGKRKDTVNTVDKAWHEFWKKRKKKKKAPYILHSNKGKKQNANMALFPPAQPLFDI